MLRTDPNIIKFPERQEQPCCASGCLAEGNVTVNLINHDTRHPAGNKYFCEVHAPRSVSSLTQEKK